jgi:hypothetical protein
MQNFVIVQEIKPEAAKFQNIYRTRVKGDVSKSYVEHFLSSQLVVCDTDSKQYYCTGVWGKHTSRMLHAFIGADLGKILRGLNSPPLPFLTGRGYNPGEIFEITDARRHRRS